MPGDKYQAMLETRYPFEPCDVSDVKLEEMKPLISALADILDLKLERREMFHGEVEFRFLKR